jgi:hypothetical protein
MFRRAYALIFYYQYENQTLQALSQQMGHFDLVQTILYITDPHGRPQTESLAASLDLSNLNAKAQLRKPLTELAKEMRDVAVEKHDDIVVSLLAGVQAGGGYSRVVQKFFARISKVSEYDHADLKAHAMRVAEGLRDKGHLPEPMLHGDCMAGTVQNIRAAKCRAKNGQVLRKELASAEVCSKCPFHYYNEGHVRGLVAEHARLAKIAGDPAASPQVRRQSESDASRLQAEIEFRETRLRDAQE